jgi:hypothetical protein
MTGPKLWRDPPDSDALLAARIEQATRPAPLTPAERARFAARVRERISAAQAPRPRWAPLVALAAAGAAVALVLAFLPAPEQAPGPQGPRAPAAPPQGDVALGDSWEEELLYAPEWIESDEGFVDAEVLPETYVVASALLES